MAHVSGEIVIARPVEEVFDFVAGERNEPRLARQWPPLGDDYRIAGSTGQWRCSSMC
jgi:hypothetical protein